MTDPKPPVHLSADSKVLWRRIVADYALELQHLRMLTLLCEALDRGEEARKVLAAEGAFTTDRYGGRRVHPAIAVERDCRLSAARLLRALELDTEPPAPPARRHRSPDRKARP